jgi:uncharacterized protein (DUF2252 family)
MRVAPQLEELSMEAATKDRSQTTAGGDDAAAGRLPHRKHPSVAERAAAGKSARKGAPRSSHGAWEPAPDRLDPVEILERQAKSRLPELVPIRYGRMLTSPFAFYRGSAAVMAADLAPTPTSGMRAQLCGDAHLSNFGAFAAPDRRLVFDLNDFDETLPGPWEWDVKRLGASFALAGRELGIGRKQRRSVICAGVGRYREAMREFAAMSNLGVWYARFDVEAALAEIRDRAPRKDVKRVERNLEKAQTKDHVKALSRLTHEVDGQLRIVSDPPLIVPIEELIGGGVSREDVEGPILELLRGYRETLEDDRRHLLDGYRYVHMARKVVGVGSVGTRAWIVLLTGRDDTDPLFLQCKEAEDSVLEPYAGKSRYKNHGARVVKGQRMMQAASDIFVGWLPVRGIDGQPRDFYVRQLWDWKRSVDVEAMSPEALEIYAQLCGWTLARAHARSGDRVEIGAYLGSSDGFDRAIGEFSELYADQAESDYGALAEAVQSGRVKAETVPS